MIVGKKKKKKVLLLLLFVRLPKTGTEIQKGQTKCKPVPKRINPRELCCVGGRGRSPARAIHHYYDSHSLVYISDLEITQENVRKNM
jgi:hypothetical protein